MQAHSELTRTTLAVLFVGGLIAASFWILWPFLPAIIWATTLVVATWPIMLHVQLRLWHKRGGVDPIMVSGHSLGEFTAFVCAGAIEFATALDLVRFRGQVMQEAVPAGQGAMAALKQMGLIK